VDITEKKRAKDELIESELRYRTLFDGASDAIFIHDIDGRIFETNLMASRYLGYTKRELMQKHMQDLAVDAEMAFSKERIGQLVSRGYILFESAQKRKEGSIIQVEISSRTTEYFGMGAVVSIVRDISERKPA
jgi:PAS domain S-box-containing protein